MLCVLYLFRGILTSSSELTRFAVFRLGFSLHLVVDGDHCDGVLGVLLQAPQDGGGGASRHLVLVGEKRSNSEPGELGNSQYLEERFWQQEEDATAELC